MPSLRQTALIVVIAGACSVVLLSQSSVSIPETYLSVVPPTHVAQPSCDRCSVSPEWCAEFGSRNMDLVQAYEGSGDRVRRVLAKAARGEPVSFAVLGGSMSQGRGCNCTPFHRQVFDWWNATFPHPGNTHTDGAVAARGTNYFKFCASEHLPDEPGPDIVLLEHSVNDAPVPADALNMEALLRHVLSLPSRPAVIVTASFALNKPNIMAIGNDVHLPVAQYYDVPVINLRHALLPVLLKRPEMVHEYFAIKSVNPNFFDLLHLSGRGHATLAQSTIAFLERQRCLLAHPPPTFAPAAHYNAAPPSSDSGPSLPLSSLDEKDEDVLPRLALTSEWAPDPADRVPSEHPSCASVDSTRHPLEPIAATTTGWARWTKPGTSKMFWRGDAPGARVDFSVDLTRGEVALYFLKSNKMGLGRARCWVDDAERSAVVLDGYWKVDQSIGWQGAIADGLESGVHTLHCEVLEALPENSDEGRGTAFLIIAVLTS